MPVCKLCGKDKDPDSFAIRSDTGKKRNQCRSCRNKQTTAVKIKQRLNKRLYLSEFRKDGCVVCGDKREYVLDAHHLDPGTKSVNIAEIMSNGSSLKRLKVELDKCIVICSNCHRELHYFEKQEEHGLLNNG